MQKSAIRNGHDILWLYPITKTAVKPNLRVRRLLKPLCIHTFFWSSTTTGLKFPCITCLSVVTMNVCLCVKVQKKMKVFTARLYILQMLQAAFIALRTPLLSNQHILACGHQYCILTLLKATNHNHLINFTAVVTLSVLLSVFRLHTLLWYFLNARDCSDVLDCIIITGVPVTVLWRCPL